MPDAITLLTDTNLFGAETAEASLIDREPLARALYAQLKDVTLEDFVSYLTNGFEAVVDYANLCAGEKTGQRISLIFNPHRLDTGTKRFPISLYQALKDERFVRGLARVVLLNKKKGATKDLLYASIGMGVQGTSYVQEFPPHVARDLALEYGLSKSSRILDPCAGWGGRMLGFSAVADSYTACEPSARTHAGLLKLLEFIRSFRSEFNASLHCAPFEDVPLPESFFDFAFTSPPYYDTEHYAPGEQTNSFNRYASFDAWCKGFYAPLVHRTMRALRSDAVFVINIGSRIYPLNDVLFKMSDGLYYVEKQKGRLSASNGLGKEGEGETFYEIRRREQIVTVSACKLEESEESPKVEQSVTALGSILAFVDATSSQHQTDERSSLSAQTGASATASETSADEDPAHAFALDLLQRQIRLLRQGDRLFTTNSSLLTTTDRLLLKTLKAQLLPLAVDYAPPELEVAPAPPNIQFSATAFADVAAGLGVTSAPPVVTPKEEAPREGSLIQFLNNAPVRPSVTEWTAKEPPVLDGFNEIRLNVETSGLNWWGDDFITGITVGYGDKNQFLPIRHAGGNLDIDTVKRWASRELRNKHVRNIHTKFDVHFLRKEGCDLEEQSCTVTDVAHYAALLDDNRRKFSLDALLRDFIGAVEVPRLDESSDDAYVARGMDRYHASEVAARAEYQTRGVQQLHEKFWPMLDAQDLQRVRQLEDDVIFPVCEMEKNGAPLNMPLLKQWNDETAEKLDAITKELSSTLGFPFNPDSSPDWQRLFEQCSIPVTLRTEKGAASFPDSYLKTIDHRYVQLGRMAGKLASLRSKFLVAYYDAARTDGILRYELHQLRGDEYGTVRGRFSASNKNIQQVMNLDTHTEHFGGTDLFEYYIRKLFIAANGANFLEADAKQIEFRIFVNHSNSPRLLKAYADNPEISFHVIVGDIVRPFRPDMPYTGIKRLNFMRLYGGGREKTALVLDLPRKESDAFFDAYNQAFPEIKTLLKTAENIAKSRGYVKTVLGRRARFTREFAYKALNAVIQGTAADIMKRKIVELHRERKQTGFLMRMTVHDQVAGDTASEETTRKVTEILNRQSFEQLKVPILWDVHSGTNWAESKG